MGHQQKKWFGQLTSPEGCPNPCRELRGRAKRYSGSYRRSFESLLARLRAQGWKVERTPGSRGGEWGATYRALSQ